MTEAGTEQGIDRDRLRADAAALAHSLVDVADEADESSQLHPAVAEALRASRLCELSVPAAYGGRLERIDPVAITIVREELMKVSAHLDSLFAMQGVGSYALAIAGS